MTTMTDRSDPAATTAGADERAELDRLRKADAEAGEQLTREERAELGRLRAREAARTPYTPTELPTTTRTQRWLLPNAGGVVVLVALPVYLVTGLPLGAWAMVAGLWLFNRIVHTIVMRFAVGMSQTMAIGTAGFGMMVRVWTLGLVLFFVGADAHIGHTHVGLGRKDLAVPALLTFLVVLTADLMVRGAFEMRRYKGHDQAPTDTETPA